MLGCASVRWTSSCWTHPPVVRRTSEIKTRSTQSCQAAAGTCSSEERASIGEFVEYHCITDLIRQLNCKQKSSLRVCLSTNSITPTWSATWSVTSLSKKVTGCVWVLRTKTHRLFVTCYTGKKLMSEIAAFSIILNFYHWRLLWHVAYFSELEP